MPDHVLHGMRWRSAVDLHLPEAAPGPAPDLVLDLGQERDVPDDRPDGDLLAHLSDETGRPMFTFVRTGDGVLLRFHRLCEFVLDPGLARATCHRAPGTDEDFVSVLAGGMLATVVLVLSGSPVLHGSAVEEDGTAVAFVGASGMGKSTLSSLLCRTGGALITDDVLRLDRAGEGLVCRSGAAESRMRGGAPDGAASARTTADGRTAVAAPRLAADRVPLRLLAVPYPSRTVDRVQVERLPGPAALVELLRFPRIVGWVDPPTSAAHFAFLADVVRRVPVLRLQVPWQGTPDERTADGVREALAAYGGAPDGRHAG